METAFYWVLLGCEVAIVGFLIYSLGIKVFQIAKSKKEEIVVMV